MFRSQIQSRRFSSLMLFGLSLFFVAITGSQLHAAEIPFEDARVRIEFNSTDQDAGLQILVDAEAWTKVVIKAPNGKMFAVRGKGQLGALGLTELFVESEEPELAELPLDQFLALFP